MKILVFTDNHFKEHASIINTYGEYYSTRIENQLESLYWVRDTAVANNCSTVICAGDFFDKPNLTDNEITAISQVSWQDGKHDLEYHFLVGNHESSHNDLSSSSAAILENTEAGRYVEFRPKTVDYGQFELCYLPYITERDRKPLEDYFGPKSGKPRIIISHNDISGIQMGIVVSTVGFSIDELEANADLVVNGHLHNGTQVSKKVINLGNLTGKDFGEDADKHPHRVAIIDTDNLSISYIENPYAFNFYKLDIMSEAEIARLSKLKNNAVVWVKCLVDLVDEVKEQIANNKNIIKSRITPIKIEVSGEQTTVDISDLTVDHLQKLVDCVHEKLGTSDIIEEVLGAILK